MSKGADFAWAAWARHMIAREAALAELMGWGYDRVTGRVRDE